MSFNYSLDVSYDAIVHIGAVPVDLRGLEGFTQTYDAWVRRYLEGTAGQKRVVKYAECTKHSVCEALVHTKRDCIHGRNIACQDICMTDPVFDLPVTTTYVVR